MRFSSPTPKCRTLAGLCVFCFWCSCQVFFFLMIRRNEGSIGWVPIRDYLLISLVCVSQLVQQRVAALRDTQQMRAQGSTSSSSNAVLTQQQQRQQDIAAEHRFVESVLDLHDKFKSITLDCFRAQQRISQEGPGLSARPVPQADSLFQKALKEGSLERPSVEKGTEKVVPPVVALLWD